MRAMALRETALTPIYARFAPVARSLSLYGIEMTVFLVFFAVYFVLRGIAVTRVDLATDNAMHIINLEQSLGVFWEPSWQREALKHDSLIDFANFMYLNMHLPFLAVFGFFIFHSDRRKHRVIRNAILLSGFMGIPLYHLVPVTPPRLLSENGVSLGFVDTIVAHSRPRPGPVTNWYAAIPSYHFGWILLGMIGAIWCWKSPFIRAGAIIFAAAMWWSIVVTANHYFFDMALGSAIVLVALYLALRWERWYETRPPGQRRLFERDGMRLPF